MQEIKIYSAWSKFAAIPNLGMRGIFLDETPGGWTMQSQAYLEELANVIRGDEGFGRSPLVSGSLLSLLCQMSSKAFKATWEPEQSYPHVQTCQ